MHSISTLAAVLLLFTTTGARADTPATNTTVADSSSALLRLERELDQHAEEGRRERISQGVMGLVLGAALLPAGIVLERRDDELVRLVSIGATITGAVQLLKVPGLFIPSDLERLRKDYLKLKASGAPPAELLRKTEEIWQTEANQERVARKVVGYFHLLAGAVAIPTGLTFMLRDSVGDLSHTKQINLGSTFLGIGIPFMAVAAELLFNKGAVQRSWDSHQLTRSDVLAHATLNMVPIAHGGMLSAGSCF